MISEVLYSLARLTENITNRLDNILAPKVDPPTEEEKARPLAKLVAPSASPHQFVLQPIDFLCCFLGLVVGGTVGGYVLFTQAKLATIIFYLLMIIPTVLGVTAGVHRLWCHRAYKAKPPLEIFLVFLFLLANQHSIITWVRTHRLHHQYSDTDADPHNASRGFFFSHFGWMMVEPHPEAQRRAKLVDVSDLMNNPIVRFQEKYIIPLYFLVAYFIPTYIPTLWGETVYVSAMSNLFRANIAMHLANSINSVAHLVGYKPIDTTIVGTQFTLVGILNLGEGFHNYHHTFPCDYRASELGDTKYNLAAIFIEMMARIGLAYDLKVTPEDVVRSRVLRKGDGSDQYYLTEETRTVQQKFCCWKLNEELKST